MMEEIIQL